MGEGKVVWEGRPHRAAAPHNAPRGQKAPPPPKEGGGGRPGGACKGGCEGGGHVPLGGGTWLTGFVGPFLGDLKSRGELWAQLYFYARARRYEVDG